MSDERKPLTDFRMTKTLNGGWVIMVGSGDYGGRPDTHAFTSSADMLDALPELIGHVPEPVEAPKEYSHSVPYDGLKDSLRIPAFMLAGCGRCQAQPACVSNDGFNARMERVECAVVDLGNYVLGKEAAAESMKEHERKLQAEIDKLKAYEQSRCKASDSISDTTFHHPV